MSKQPIVFISAGHGGSDPGAVGNGLLEKNINLQIALADGAVLERHGIKVIYSRTKDEYDPVGQEVREANASGAILAVSHHTNSTGGAKADGSETFHHSSDANGKRLAEMMEEETKKLGQNSRGVRSRDDLYFIRATNMTAVLTESAFINNAADISILDTVKEQQAFGQAYAKAILRYLGIAYKPVTTSQSTTGKVEPVKVDYAKSFNIKYARTYTVKSSDGLNMRAGANTSKTLIKNVANGEKVQCYGYFTKEVDGTIWLLVSYKGYTGFMSMGYLK